MEWDNNTPEGREAIRAYQGSVFLAVFGTANPDFKNLALGPGAAAVAVDITHLRPSQLQAVRDLYSGAGVVMSNVLAGVEPEEEDRDPGAAGSSAGGP